MSSFSEFAAYLALIRRFDDGKKLASYLSIPVTVLRRVVLNLDGHLAVGHGGGQGFAWVLLFPDDRLGVACCGPHHTAQIAAAIVVSEGREFSSA